MSLTESGLKVVEGMLMKRSNGQKERANGRSSMGISVGFSAHHMDTDVCESLKTSALCTEPLVFDFRRQFSF